ncbi:agmatinase [Thermodesulfobacteriota bacterium]
MQLNEPPFLECASRQILPGRCAIVGVPLDLTATFRSGCSEAPPAMRVASDSIESYSPFLDLDLADIPFSDIGDLSLSGVALDAALAAIRDTIGMVLERGALPFCLGGEHTLTLPIVQAFKEVYPDLVVVHGDAHSDMRDDYEGNRVNHATVIRRVLEVVGSDGLVQLGVHSGTREEFISMRRADSLLQWGPGMEQSLLEKSDDRPVYLTLDVDVMDPACLPGTGNPEPGGWFYPDFERLLTALDRMNLVGADLVELNPRLDASGVSAITAAKMVRELLLVMGKKRRYR